VYRTTIYLYPDHAYSKVVPACLRTLAKVLVGRFGIEPGTL